MKKYQDTFTGHFFVFPYGRMPVLNNFLCTINDPVHNDDVEAKQ